MASIILDFSGIDGLAEGHQGDLNDSTSQPHTKYLGKDGQFADGTFNPMLRAGYIAPANDTYAAVTSISNWEITGMAYDNATDKLYLAHNDNNIGVLDGLNDSSETTYLTITDVDSVIRDMVLYEVNGQKSLVYINDSQKEKLVAIGSSNSTDYGMYLGFTTLDPLEGATAFDIDLNAYDNSISTQNVRVSYPSVLFNSYRKLAQRIKVSDIPSKSISGVSFACRNDSANPGLTETFTISIELDADPASGTFTSRGAWSNAVTNYALNNTVTNGGNTYMCIQAHSASATADDEPGVGSNWWNYWRIFAAPSGTYQTSTTFDINEIPVRVGNGNERFNFEFASTYNIPDAVQYIWVVVSTTLSAGTYESSFNIKATTNNENLYPSGRLMGLIDAVTDYWVDATSANEGDGSEMDVRLITNRNDKWTLKRTTTNTGISGGVNQETGVNTFLHLSDNGLLYWFAGNDVHVVDGSIVGGNLGRLNPRVLTFPSYIQIAGVSETRSKMFIALNNTNYTDSTDKVFESRDAGVFVWDRRSQTASSSDYLSAPGAREIRSIFRTTRGDIALITKSNTGMSEVRMMEGNSFSIFKTFEKDGAPRDFRAVATVSNMNVWVGVNGVFYAFGKVSQAHNYALYKIGDLNSYITGDIYVSRIGNYNTLSVSPTALLLSAKETVTKVIVASQVDSTVAININSDYTGFGQSFIGKDVNITDVSLFVSKTGSPTGSLGVSLYEAALDYSSGNIIPGTFISNLGSISNSSITGTKTLFNITFSPITLEEGKKYVITVAGNWLGTVTNYFTFYGSSAVTGSGNASKRTTVVSDVYVPHTTNDMSFILNGYGYYKTVRWYPSGIGTINTVAQKGHQGDVYSLVRLLPSMSTVRSVDIRCLPTTSTGSTVIGTVKYYFNQAITPSITKTITLDDASRGYIRHEINKPYVNTIQAEVEFSTLETLGSNSFLPYSFIVDYEDTTTATKDRG